MKQAANGYLSSRVLKYNVGFLLADGPGHSHSFELDVPSVQVAHDLVVNYLRGPVRFSRTKEGILVQAHLLSAVEDECYRCLDPVESEFAVELEELYATQPALPTPFHIGEDALLDLAPLLREEALIALSSRAICQADCKGLCPECGANLNHGLCDCHLDEIDPRLAVLKKLLDAK